MPAHDDELDLRGIPCPANAARAVLQIAMMSEGEGLLVYVDDGEPVENVLRSLEVAGHAIEHRERDGDGWKVLVRISG
jgi:TusA-related sulfurtransferase